MNAPAENPERTRGAAEVRRLAVGGAALVGLRGILVNLMTAGGAVVLAHLLEPRDFGVLALGITITNSARFLADAGIGASFIRQQAEPEPADLRALLSFQLAVTTALTVLAAAVALPLGDNGAVIALMIASLPFAAFRTPGMAMAERHLQYRPVVWAETVEAVVFNAVAITAVLAGFGLWGVAGAMVFRTIVGSSIMIIFGPVRFVRPSWSWGRVRRLLKFGSQYQAVGLTNVIRDQGLAAGIAAIAGLSVLGLWGLAYRVIQVPLLLFSSLWRVSYPAMARMMGANEDLGPILERATRNLVVPTCLMLVVLSAGAGAAIPAVLGDVWKEATYPLPFAFLGLAIGGPVSVAAAGYLYAAGDAATILRSAILHTCALFMVGLGLLPWLGVMSIGIGSLLSGIIEGAMLGRGVARKVPGTNLLRVVVVPCLVATLAGGLGWLVADRLGDTLISAVVAALTAGILYLALLTLVRPAMVKDSWNFTSRIAHRAF